MCAGRMPAEESGISRPRAIDGPPAATPTPMPGKDGSVPAWLRAPPHLWQPGTLDRDALHAAADELARSAGFAAAAAGFAVSWQAAYDGNATLRAVIRNSARYMFLVTCMYMHHRRRADEHGDGITVSRIIESYRGKERFGTVASPSRVKAFVAHCKQRGLLRPAADVAMAAEGDARVRRLEPTPKLEASLGEWTLGFLRGIAPVLPLPAPPEVMVHQPGFVGELFSYRVAALVQDGFALPERHPFMQWIMSREKGYHVFLSLVREMCVLADGSAIADIQPAVLARRAAVSRGTVLNLLDGCERQGLIVREGTCRRLHLQPGFVERSLQWVALEFLWMHGLAVAAWARVAAPR